MLKLWLRCALVVALTLIASDAPTAAPRDIATLISELNALNTPNYTGGLPRRNRALAEEIRSAMTPQFPPAACPPNDWREGTLIGLDDDAVERNRTTTAIDPGLAQLLKAFDYERQEVRDTAAYTIGLLGPSAKDAAHALAQRFASREGKGNWHNDAYGKVTCQRIGAADFRKVIPDALLPPQEPWDSFLRKAAVLMARLYLDPDIEYPPDMMGHAYGNYAIANHATDAVPLLAQILDNDRLSLQKQIEAADALRNLDPEMAKPALPALLRKVDTASPALRFSVTEALIRANHPAVIPLLIKRVEDGYDHWSWKQALCDFGPAALAAEDALLNHARRAGIWPSDQRAAYRVLGCIGSRKAVPVLIAALTFPDWETQGAIAIALGQISDPGAEAIDALERLASHWSRRVRSAAENALAKHGRRPRPPEIPGVERVEELDVVTIGDAGAVDHGLPWCDDSGKYSIDGRSWFRVRWMKRARAAIPKGFPKDLPDFGTRQFVRVADGWLYGADFGHYGGRFQHISNAGKVTELDETWHNATQGFVQDGKTILAYGLQLLKSGDGGVLFDVARTPDGVWRSTRIATLPSPADAQAKAPSGEILLTDGANTYALIDNEVVPLKCEKTHPGSYFKQNDTR
jgi:hypothetical protein